MKFCMKQKYPLILQHDQSDCGVACLLTLIQYHGGNNNLENLRRLSGTNTTGTTLLGLYQAANQLGFSAEGCEADIPALIEHGRPCILHVTLENNLQHYVVCYGFSSPAGRCREEALIADPAKGLIQMPLAELEKIWQSKTCLTLEPNEKFVKAADTKKAKQQWIISLIKEDYPLLGIAAGLGVAIAALGLVMAIFSQKLIDDILPNKNFEKLYLGIALVFILLLIKEGLSVLRQLFLIRQAKSFNIRIIGFFFSHLLALPKPFFDTRKTGEFTARLNDTQRIQRVISQLAGSMAIDVLMVLVSISFVFIYSVTAGLICLVAMPLFFWMVYVHNKIIIEGQRNIMVNYAQTESNYISTLQGIEPIKNNNRQSLFEKVNNIIYQKFQEAVYKLGIIQIKLSVIINTFSVVFLVGILSYCSNRVLHNQLKTGELIAIVSICGSLLPGVVNLALIMIPVNEAKIAFDRMFEFTSVTPENNAGNVLQEDFKKITIQNLCFRFAGRKQLLHNLSFEIKKGEIVALMGENGCGKSTLSQLLQKNYQQESGNIIINDDYLLQNIELKQWRKMVATVPQNIHIFNGSVLENIAYDDAANKPNEVLVFLQKYGFASFIDTLPQSFMTLVGEEGINLSGGQKQIIALARALYHKPQLLILDEATAAMDRDSEQFVLKLLMQLKKDMAIVFITHRLHVLKSFCDRIYIIENGTITNSGTHQSLLQQGNLYSKYWADLVLA